MIKMPTFKSIADEDETKFLMFRISDKFAFFSVDQKYPYIEYLIKLSSKYNIKLMQIDHIS